MGRNSESFAKECHNCGKVTERRNIVSTSNLAVKENCGFFLSRCVRRRLVRGKRGLED